jgi:hypothetical protein
MFGGYLGKTEGCLSLLVSEFMKCVLEGVFGQKLHKAQGA